MLGLAKKAPSPEYTQTPEAITAALAIRAAHAADAAATPPPAVAPRVATPPPADATAAVAAARENTPFLPPTHSDPTYRFMWGTPARRGLTLGISFAVASIATMYAVAYGIPGGAASLPAALARYLMEKGASDVVANIFSHLIPDVGAVVALPAAGLVIGETAGLAAERCCPR